MNEQDVYQALNEIFSDIFDTPITLLPETTAKDIDGWDSLEHIHIIGVVERRFKIKFKMGEISKMKNVGEMVSILMERGKLA